MPTPTTWTYKQLQRKKGFRFLYFKISNIYKNWSLLETKEVNTQEEGWQMTLMFVLKKKIWILSALLPWGQEDYPGLKGPLFIAFLFSSPWAENSENGQCVSVSKGCNFTMGIKFPWVCQWPFLLPSTGMSIVLRVKNRRITMRSLITQSKQMDHHITFQKRSSLSY